ncbi:MAG TPA: histidine phosphatase family protein [Candidatus Saccharimonadales bacterium]|nr:histidine phosphatase family protein [Candidatus Saccharimonadales bacterium]
MTPRVSLYLAQHAKGYQYIKTPTKDFYDSQAPLTPGGKLMGKALGAYFHENDIHFDSIISSPYRRAYETADGIAAYAGIPVRLEIALRDLWGSEKELHATTLFQSTQPEVSYGDYGENNSTRYFKAQAAAAQEQYGTVFNENDDLEELLESYSHSPNSYRYFGVQADEDDDLEKLLEDLGSRLQAESYEQRTFIPYVKTTPLSPIESLYGSIRLQVSHSSRYRFDYEDLDVCIVGHKSLAVALWLLEHPGESVPDRSVLEPLYPMKEARGAWKVDLDIGDFRVIRCEFMELPEWRIKEVENQITSIESSRHGNKEC